MAVSIALNGKTIFGSKHIDLSMFIGKKLQAFVNIDFISKILAADKKVMFIQTHSAP